MVSAAVSVVFKISSRPTIKLETTTDNRSR